MISDVSLLASNRLFSSFSPESGAKDMGIDSEQTHDRLWVDPASCCYALYSKLDADKVLLQPSPLSLSKALKVTKWLLLPLFFIVFRYIYCFCSLVLEPG